MYAAAVRTVKIGLQPDITKIDIKGYCQSFPNVRFIQTTVIAKEARRAWNYGKCSLRASIKVNCMPHELELSGENVDDLAIRISDPRLGLTGPQPSFRLVSLQFGPPTVPLQQNTYIRNGSECRDSSTSTFLISRSDAEQGIKSKLDEKDESMQVDVLRSTASDDLSLFGYIRHLHLLDRPSATDWLRRLITCTCHLKSLAVIADGDGKPPVSLWTALAPSVNTLESIQLYGNSSGKDDEAWRFSKEFIGRFDNKRLNFIRGNFNFDAAVKIQRKRIPSRTNPSSPIRRVELYMEDTSSSYSTFPLVLGAILTETFHADCRLINQEVQSSRDDMNYALDWAEAQSGTRSVSSALYLRRNFLKLIRKRLTPGFKNVGSTDHQSDGDDSDSSEVSEHSSDMGSDRFDD
jgi:hypothetical protein